MQVEVALVWVASPPVTLGRWKKLASSYFSPTRAPNHTIIVSNFAITPQMRLTQMNFWSDLFPGDSMQFRSVCVPKCVAATVCSSGVALCCCVQV